MSNSKTILVVEDEHAIRDIMMWALQNQDYDVLVAENAEEAMPLVEKADLVLLNLKLPGMSGERFIEKVRAEGNFTPMIVVTATPMDAKIEDRLVELKIVDWVAKPFSTKDLLARIQRALEISGVMEGINHLTERLKSFVVRQEASRHRAAGMI
jgi:DNA-binding response OmpR family regulator